MVKHKRDFVGGQGMSEPARDLRSRRSRRVVSSRRRSGGKPPPKRLDRNPSTKRSRPDEIRTAPAPARPSWPPAHPRHAPRALEGVESVSAPGLDWNDPAACAAWLADVAARCKDAVAVAEDQTLP